ncbi:UDP-3-O-acyl-N-acetylglucosamine deacetylase [Caldovatus aquaticus]|uniref:UDP-3-O-acyl-N-acetylglucosamine deacetylase n=1 Tax=Caldovatus aquaticus TaxID=2865671 RepID=A0ABS7EX81_9PROT|nr:UDP-3-O-acyl-N-acetylglucosamine deacetylase [Caldovatus aquaticus]MBW8267878.1 UDP-3-O-acyl-N-acetylglucosamine deacetylase [Caldovatus aquaticus]
MDGYLLAGAGQTARRRRTLKSSIGCVGTGLHTGRRVRLTLHPAAAGSGIRFRRADLGGIEIPARFDHVVDTRLCTALRAPGAPDARVGTVEHLMAAFVACGIDDAVAELDGPEVPILDGSAAPFVFLLDCAGSVATTLPQGAIEVLRPVRVEDGAGGWAELRPGPEPAFDAALEIDFPNTAIGRQSLALRLTPRAVRSVLAPARTFTLAEDVARLRAAGLAQGGSLANAVVVDGPLVLNPGGLRCPDEFVRHKLLDLVGDLALAGLPIRGRFAGYRSGHALNNRLLHALFAEAGAFRVVGGAEREPALAGAALPGPAMAENGGSAGTARLPAAAAPAVA